MTVEDREQAIFGSFDGLTTGIGIIAALILAGHSKAVVVGVMGAAVAAAVGMGAGKWLSTPDRNYGTAGVMFIATLIGGAAPGIPFTFLPLHWAVAATSLIAVGVALQIGWFRGAGIRGYVETAVVLVLVTVLTVATGAGLG